MRLLLLTGQRRAKVATMRWEDLANSVWTIPAEAREKTNAGSLKLPQLALDIIDSITPMSGNPHIFAGRGKAAVAGFSPLKVELDKKMTQANGGKAVERWTLHDLRRTAKSLMSRAGVLPHVSERVLGHAIQGVEGVYERHDWTAEKEKALKMLAGLVALVLKPPKGNVAVLERAA